MGPILGPWARNLGPGAQIMGPILGPKLDSPLWEAQTVGFTSGQIARPRSREPHIQVRRPMVYRLLSKSSHLATRFGLPRGDIVFFQPNHPNLGGDILGIFGLGMARPGLGMAWPGLGMAWPGLGMAWPGWVWRGLAGYGVAWLGKRVGP